MTMKRFIFLCVLCLSALPVVAETITGQVVRVSDGDTLTLLDDTNTQYKIRLTAIDAPELGQPYGYLSKQALVDLCFKQTASIEVTGKDRYGRLVAIVTCNDTNANEAMLNLGMAWVYQRFKKRYPHYDALEQDARYDETGLWMDEDPVPPWVWRHHKRGR